MIRNGHLVESHDRRELRDDDLVKVVRVWHRVHVRKVRYDPPTRTRAVNSLKPGERKVARPGRDGIRKVRVRAEVHNGTVVDREVRKRWERKPQPRVVLVGKRQRTVPGTGHLNWAALARCESGGNPNAVNPAGYYGLYQFSISDLAGRRWLRQPDTRRRRGSRPTARRSCTPPRAARRGRTAVATSDVPEPGRGARR